MKKDIIMRIVHLTLAAAAAFTLTAAPLAAQSAPEPTVQESVACMLNTLPFVMVASVNNPEALVELEGAGNFWADYADLLGEPTEADMAAAEATGTAMIEDFGKLESEADFPAFLAPYQAKFDACEDMRKTLQAG